MPKNEASDIFMTEFQSKYQSTNSFRTQLYLESETLLDSYFQVDGKSLE